MDYYCYYYHCHYSYYYYYYYYSITINNDDDDDDDYYYYYYCFSQVEGADGWQVIDATPQEEIRGNHLSNTTCLIQVFSNMASSVTNYDGP